MCSSQYLLSSWLYNINIFPSYRLPYLYLSFWKVIQSLIEHQVSRWLSDSPWHEKLHDDQWNKILDRDFSYLCKTDPVCSKGLNV